MCFVLPIPGWIHMESGACSTCKITTSKRIGLEKGENGTLYALTGNNPIADVCHALKNVAAKMNAVADAHVNVPDSHGFTLNSARIFRRPSFQRTHLAASKHSAY